MSTKDPNRDPTWRSLVLSATSVLALGALFFMIAYGLIVPAEALAVTQIEAAVAATGTAFSGLAFAGVLYSLAMQRRELHLQRVELAQTRDILSQQNDTLTLQRFEVSFYNLLKAHRDLVDATSAVFEQTSSEQVRGVYAYTVAAQELRSRFIVRGSFETTPESFRSWADAAFQGVCFRPKSDFQHYVRSLFHLVRFCKRSALPDKVLYVQLLRAQMTNGERMILFFYGQTSDGAGMKEYIERYHLLRGLRVDPMLDHVRSRYRPAAFGATPRTTIPEPPELAR